jgi:putative ABC transport system permease protein
MRFSLWMYVWRHLTSNRLRLWLTGAAIAIGVASISSMLIIANSGMRVMSQPGNTFGATDIIVRLKAGVDPDEFAAKIKTIPRVTTVLTEKTWPLGTDKIAGKTEIRLMLRGVEHQEGQPDRAYYLKKGRLPSRPGEVALSADFAKVKKLGIGDNYRPKNIDTNLTIVGLTADGQDVSDGAAFVYVLLTYFNSHFSGAPALGELKILVNSAADQPIVKKDIQRRLSDAGSVLTRQEFQESSAKNALMTEALFGLFGAIALFVGALLIYTTFSLTAAERVREYAILRAIGGRRLHIRRLVYGEALLLGLTFSVIGLVLGAALSYLLLWLSLRTGIISGMSFSDLELRPAIICVSVLSGVAVTWLSALGPARRASRTTPMTGIRVEKENLNRHPGVSLLGVGLALIGVLGVVYFCVTANPEGSADAVFIGAAGVFAVLIGFALAMPIIIRPVLKVAP